MMNREQVKELFRKIKLVYSNFEVSSEKVDLWHDALKTSNPAIVMRNFEHYYSTERFPPTIADVKEHRNRTHVLGLEETKKVIEGYSIPKEKRLTKEQIRALFDNQDSKSDNT